MSKGGHNAGADLEKLCEPVSHMEMPLKAFWFSRELFYFPKHYYILSFSNPFCTNLNKLKPQSYTDRLIIQKILARFSHKDTKMIIVISNYSKSYRENCNIYLSIKRKMIYFAPRHKKRPTTQARKLDMIGFLILD